MFTFYAQYTKKIKSDASSVCSDSSIHEKSLKDVEININETKNKE
jgi:hypothetical protein